MRYDVPVYFQKVERGKYNPDAGSFGEDFVSEEMRFADVTDLKEDLMKLVYGELRRGCKIIRLQTHYKIPFERIRIGEKLYAVDFSRELRTKHIFVVSELSGSRYGGEGV